jgi:DNA invertase Pin-like site-specific DNA recombinase
VLLDGVLVEVHGDGSGTGCFGEDVSGIGSGGVAGRDDNDPCRNGSELSAVGGYQMITDINQKVNAGHLKRNAYLYIRQSTPRQVLEHQESGKRQYALRQRATALGWPLEQIHVIDSDQGQSGSSAADREGFQKLVTEVSLGRAGIVLGLEVSRLARNNTDWHRLLEICALTDTLILDEDGTYDPAHFNDRLLLGLKGTMSEAELHVLHARMRGGALNKARRGELIIPLPVGLVYDPQGQVILDPDKQVQESIRLLFATFRRIGSALGTAKAYREQGLLFPHRVRGGLHDGDLLWGELGRTRVVHVLRNPRYAGAFVYGRNRSRAKPDGSGRCSHRVPQEQWHTILKDVHPGYITWQEFEENLRRLKENAQAHGSDRMKSPPREGPALLQGIVICGMCGARMLVRYRDRGRGLESAYACFGENSENGRPRCQIISGKAIDQALSKLIVESVNPLALEVALSVQKELQSRLEEADRLRRAQVERTRFEAEQAQRRYMRVDPANRLVADSLEADWNAKLRVLEEAQTAYESQRQADRRLLEADEEAKIYALASNFGQLWESPTTTDRERKRMIRLLIDDVTLVKGVDIAAHVRFKGGATRSLVVAAPLCWREKHKTSPEILQEIDRLLDDHTYDEIATILNDRGLFTRVGNPYGPVRIMRIQQRYGLKSRYDRLREAGYLTDEEMAKHLGVSPKTVAERRKRGLLKAAPVNDRPEYLYERP